MIKNFIFLFFIISIVLKAQVTDSSSNGLVSGVRIDSIAVVGNEETDTDIIERELTFSTGDTINQQTLEYNRERIYSLGIFSSVNLTVSNELDKNVLLITVKESWYIYPLPFISLVDHDWKKISYGINVIVKNFRGRNELLEASGALGYDPSTYLSYSNPYLFWKENIFLKAIVSYINLENKSQVAETLHGNSFNQKFFQAEIGIGKRLNLYNRIETILGYDYVSTPFYLHGINASNGRIDRVPSIGFDYNFDSRDLIQFPKKGFYGDANIFFKGMGINNIDYRILTLDLRNYNEILTDLYLKERITTRFTNGKEIPYYDYSFLGYEERIRGYFNDIREGNNYYIGSIEMFTPLLKDTDLNLEFLPLLPKELLNYRIAIYAETFFDAGTTQFRGQSFDINDFESGYGIGLTFLVLPYNLLRLEFALNQYRRSEWILEIGTSF
jgi:outer membrane protein assembly factor BamA